MCYTSNMCLTKHLSQSKQIKNNIKVINKFWPTTDNVWLKKKCSLELRLAKINLYIIVLSKTVFLLGFQSGFSGKNIQHYVESTKVISPKGYPDVTLSVECCLNKDPGSNTRITTRKGHKK